MARPLHQSTRQTIKKIFQSLDYTTLGMVYCDEGGENFWEEKRGPCQQLGIKLATTWHDRLQRKGRSLYVGAGVAEIPMLVMETLELERTVEVYNLRQEEVSVLNHACYALPFTFQASDARSADGTFDHLWMVSVLNDSERFPTVSALSYGRANPVTFDEGEFHRERTLVRSLATDCLNKLSSPGLVTTSVEEIPWVTDWAARGNIPCHVEHEDYSTAIVGDPVCFIRIG